MDAQLQKRYSECLADIARSKGVNIYDKELMYSLAASADLSKPLRVIHGFQLAGRQYRYGEQVTFTEDQRGYVMQAFRAGQLVGEAEYQVFEAWPAKKELRRKLEEAHRVAINAETQARQAAGRVQALKAELAAAQGEQTQAEADAARLASALAELLN